MNRIRCSWIDPIAVALICVSVANITHAAPPGGGWRLSYADEFSGDSVDSLRWQTRYPWGRAHNHNAYMQDRNVVLGDGTASLIATREPTNGKAFSSGVISTGYNRYTFTGGYAEARILLPNTPGSWPAFWGLYTGWPPESDIMEYPIDTAAGNGYGQGEYHTAWHYSTGGGGNAAGAGKVNPSSAGDLGDSYHVFGMEWREDDYVRFYFDGQQVSSFGTDSAIAQMEHMYLILNYAVGGWPGNPNQGEWPDGFADQTKIDWVRVWQRPPSTGSTDWVYDDATWGWWGTADNWDNFEPNHSRQKAYFDTLAAQPSMEVRWNRLKTVGEIYIDGTTTYTIGDDDGDLDSLMLADDGDGWARIWVTGGTGGHVVNSRLEAWSHLSIKNDAAAPLTINGDLIGHARGTSAGGSLLVRGAGRVVLNGVASYQRGTEVTDGATLHVNSHLYDGIVTDTAAVDLNGGGILSLDNLNDNAGSLGNLPRGSERIVIDGGILELRQETSTRRGMMIGAGGATLRSLGGLVRLRESVDHPLVTASGGTLTLGGTSDGVLSQTLAGEVGLTKAGGGTWSLVGDHHSVDAVSIQDGRFAIYGRLSARTLNVGDDGTLAGHAAVSASVSNSGAIEPGGMFAYTPESSGKIRFNFQGVQDNVPLTAATAQDADLTVVAGLDLGPGLTTRHPSGGGSNNGDELNVSSWSTGLRLENAIDGDDYLTFSVAPVAGVEMQLDTVSFELWRNGSNAPTNYAVLTSIDGFAAGDQLVQFGVADPDDGSSGDPTDLIGYDNRRRITGEYTGSQWTDNAVEVRLYGWGAGENNGNTHVTAAELSASFRTIGGSVSLDPTGRLTIAGDLTHSPGAVINIELLGTDNSDPLVQQHDSLAVSGLLSLQGDLNVSILRSYSPQIGDTFDILDFRSLVGSFASVTLPALPSGLAWDDTSLLVTGELAIVWGGASLGDYNADGVVDAADYAVWRDTFGSTGLALAADGNNDHIVDDLDYSLWRENFGTTVPTSLMQSSGEVPEPATLGLAVMAGLLAASRRRR